MPSRIDIGPEGGPFVAVNENNNDLELQDINGNVIAKWDETAGHWDFANNSLTNLAAVETGEASINNWPSQDPRELVGYDQSSGTQSVNLVVENLDRGPNDTKFVIEVLYFESLADTEQVELELDIEGQTSYDYIVKDDDGNTSKVTNDDHYSLIRTAGAGSGAEVYIGEWTFSMASSRPGLFGGGSPTQNPGGDTLERKADGNTGTNPFDLTLSASANDELRWEVAIWQVQPRSDVS